MSEEKCPPQEATISELEGITNTTRQNLYKHIRRAGICARNRRYNVREVVMAIIRHRQADNRNLTSGTHRARKLELECRLLEIRLAQLESELVSAAGLRRTWEGLVGAFRARMLAIPTRAAAEAAGRAAPEVEAVMKRHIHDALEELARYDPDAESDGSSGGNGGGSAA